MESKLKILIAHNLYQNRGGEDRVVENESKMLRKRGHEVTVANVSNDSIRGPLAALQAGLSATESRFGKEWMARKIRDHRPDVVHVHNFFPLLSPSVFDACLENSVPSVLTLHNYRILCANALLLRNGKPCELCIGGSAFQGALHGCYRGSRLASLPVAQMIAHHRREKTWEKKVTQLIAVSDFEKSKFVQGGIASSAIAVKPHFVPDEELTAENPTDTKERSGAIYIGRLSEEKGVRLLLEAWKDINVPLKLIGSGPLREELERMRTPHVQFVNSLSRSETLEHLRQARFLVVPSTCYETFSMVVVEAFSQGIPVLAVGHGAPADLVSDRRNGLLFKPGDADSLAERAREMSENPDLLQSLSKGARASFKGIYTEEENCRALVGIYKTAVDSRP
jgi:glycosyltransferase involved in cell wall biosynthesis